MKRLACLFILLYSVPAISQIKIEGTVKSNKNKPIEGASVVIEGSYDGATADSLGHYSFVTSESGEQILKVTASSYNPAEEKIIIGKKNLVIQFSLKEKITELEAVVISAGSFIASDQKKASALKPLDVVTTASSNGSITDAFKTLPGAQQVGESEGLFVRGGTSSEAKYFIDGSLVNDFFYTSKPGMASRERFNPFLFTGYVFSSGGYSALYGQALSSVLIMESIDLPDKTSANFGLSYLSANAGIQKLSKNKRSSWGTSYSYTNLALVYNLIKQKEDYFRIPVIHQGDFNFRTKTSSTGFLKYYVNVSHTNVALRNQDVDSLSLKDAFSLRDFNMYHNLSWRENLGNRWKINTGLSYTYDKNNIGLELQDADNKRVEMSNDPIYSYKNVGIVSKGNYANAKIVLEKKFGGLNALRFGAENNYSNEKTAVNNKGAILKNQVLKENILSAFAETDIYITNKWGAKLGTRIEHSQLLQNWNIAPRISLAYQFPDRSQASFAYGIFYQNPDSKYLPAMNALHFQKATHYILQYSKTRNGRNFRTEIFYKKYDDLIKTEGYSAKAINNNGFGDAKGIEFFWRDRKSITNFDYWISYSYLDTKRNFLNYPFALEPSFAAKHTASLVVKKFVMPIKTQFNASYTFATGRPYYNMMVDNGGKTIVSDQGRTVDFNNLSLSVNYVPSVGKKEAKSFMVIVLSLTNVLGADNVYGYNYSANGKNKVALIPPAKRFFYLGCFISLGIDRTEDAINNHL
ncbi:MAG: TonB-dependent receptor [Ginsengibacter sp.]